MLAILLLLSMMIAPVGTDWASIIKPVSKQVPRLEILAADSAKPAKCSGVIINAAEGYVLTAAHCVEGTNNSLTVNGRHGEVIKTNRLLDLAIVKTFLRTEKEMILATKTPSTGSEIAIAGYSFGSEEITVQFGRISQPLNPETKSLWLDGRIIPGQSGGAVINTKGELVGMTSSVYYSGASDMGAAVPIEQIADFVIPYIPAVVKK